MSYQLRATLGNDRGDLYQLRQRGEDLSNTRERIPEAICCMAWGFRSCLRASAQSAQEAWPSALTAWEKSVLEQLMIGLSNKAVARRLNLCLGTVKTHVKSILEKLSADSRTAAVMAAQRRGRLP